MCGSVYLCVCYVAKMEIEYLPVYNPSPDELADPELYAENVRQVCAFVCAAHRLSFC